MKFPIPTIKIVWLRIIFDKPKGKRKRPLLGIPPKERSVPPKRRLMAEMTEKREEIKRLRVEEKWTLEGIGNKYGLSRERVRQILKSVGVTGLPYAYESTRKCTQCKKEVPIIRRPHNPFSRNFFCSDKCRKDYHTVLLTCDGCGKMFTRSKVLVSRNVGQKKFFCSQQCGGRAVAKIAVAKRK